MQKGKFKVAIVLVFLILGVSCKFKNESETQEISIEKKTAISQQENKEAKKNVFEIEITYKVSQDDVFQVFYTSDDASEHFSTKSMIRKKVFGSDEFNTVKIQLPKNMLPYKIRIDLGEKKEQGEIGIQEIKLKYLGREIDIKKELILEFFSINEFLKYDYGKGIFKSSLVNNRYDPFIISSALLNQKIKIEL